MIPGKSKPGCRMDVIGEYNYRACMDEQAHLAAGDSHANRKATRSLRSELGPLAWNGPLTRIQ